MTSLDITRHGEVRMSQRGFRRSDLDVLLAHATEMGGDRLMLRARDADRAIAELKRRMATLQRLRNTVVVVSEGSLVTAYHQTASEPPPRGKFRARQRKQGKDPRSATRSDSARRL